MTGAEDWNGALTGGVQGCTLSFLAFSPILRIYELLLSASFGIPRHKRDGVSGSSKTNSYLIVFQ